MRLVIISLLLFAYSFANETRTTIAQDERNEIETVLDLNDKLFNAFLKEDSKQIETAAQALQTEVTKSKSKILEYTRLKAETLSKIKGSNKINLKHYQEFNDQLVDLVNKYQVNNRFNIFYCPMVKKSWIQDVKVNKDVRNVYAMEMLECGVQKTNF